MYVKTHKRAFFLLVRVLYEINLIILPLNRNSIPPTIGEASFSFLVQKILRIIDIASTLNLSCEVGTLCKTDDARSKSCDQNDRLQRTLDFAFIQGLGGLLKVTSISVNNAWFPRERRRRDIILKRASFWPVFFTALVPIDRIFT